LTNKINKPILTGAYFDADRSGFICCDGLANGGRISIAGFRGLTTSHLTRILNE